MKITVKSILVMTLLTYATHSFAQQNSVGVNTSSPNPNAVLELVSPNNNQGFLVPRLTTAQRSLMENDLRVADDVNGLMVYDTDRDQYYFWKDDEWKEGLGIFDGFAAGGDLAGTYPNPTIALNAVTSNKIGTNAVTNSKIQAGAVTTEKIEDLAVTTEKIVTSGVTAGTYGNEYSIAQFTVNDRGFITVAQEVVIQIDSSNIKDLSIIGDDIKNGTIPITKIDTENLTDKVLTIDASGAAFWTDRSEFASPDLDQNNIYVGDASNLAQGLPVSGDLTLVNNGTSAGITINDNTIDTDNIIDGEINTVDIANDAVTNAKIIDDAITTNKIQDGQVQTADLENLTVTNGKIAVDAITTDKIGNGEVLNEDLDKANIPLSGFGTAEADIDIGSNRLVNVTDPTDAQDAATKNYVDTSIDADNDLPRGNIFVGDATDEAVALDANDDGKILIGDGTDLNSVDVSGDVLIDNTGATEIQDNAVQGMI